MRRIEGLISAFQAEFILNLRRIDTIFAAYNAEIGVCTSIN
jgi:hypothetical protein